MAFCVPLDAARCRPLPPRERKWASPLGLLSVSQADGRRFEPGLALQNSQAPSATHAVGVLFSRAQWARCGTGIIKAVLPVAEIPCLICGDSCSPLAEGSDPSRHHLFGRRQGVFWAILRTGRVRQIGCAASRFVYVPGKAPHAQARSDSDFGSLACFQLCFRGVFRRFRDRIVRPPALVRWLICCVRWHGGGLSLERVARGPAARRRQLLLWNSPACLGRRLEGRRILNRSLSRRHARSFAMEKVEREGRSTHSTL